MKVPTFDVIIIGGSHAGLSAALILGRSLRKTLIIDDGKPRNEPSPEAHSLYTRDGQSPMALIKIGKEQLAPYKTISFESGFVREARITGDGFEVEHNGQTLTTKIIILATGLKDQMPDVSGFKELWGNKVLHCPFCHGFEVMGLKIGYVGKPGAVAKANTMYGHWYDHLVMVTNDQEFTPADVQACKASNVPLLEGKILSLSDTENGLAVSTDKGEMSLGRLYWEIPLKRNSELAEKLGCELEPEQAPDKGQLIKVDENYQTTVDGVYAIGDLSESFTQVVSAMYSGAKAAVSLNQQLWGFTRGDRQWK
jgi:thioredoxin reductase